jgi:hypothetical protein
MFNVEHNSNTYMHFSGYHMRNYLISKQKIREGFISQDRDTLLAYDMYVIISYEL